MSKLSELKSYLVDDGYLFNELNNGNVVMISGQWGSGKTHFWKNEIEPEFTKLNDDAKAYVYISLYGKENTESIKNEILLKAYESVKKENKTLQRSISVFDNISKVIPSISIWGIKFDSTSIEGFLTSKKVNQAKEFLIDGGVICFDDFERKSKKIDLNDLFGLITQLAQEMQCKIVLILNSDVFEGKDAIVFRNVKEKTVNKFLYFSPSIEELFYSIFDEKKYRTLIPYKEDILNWIKNTDELNARFYIQILDNCLEWISKDLPTEALKAITYISIFFSKHHFTLEYEKEDSTKMHTTIKYFLDQGFYEIAEFLVKTAPQIFSGTKPFPLTETIQLLMSDINKQKKENKVLYSEDYLKRQNEEVEKNRVLIVDFIKYIYFLNVEEELGEDIYCKVNNFIQSGILLKDN